MSQPEILPNHLRVGNLLLHNGSIRQVKAIGQQSVFLYSVSDSVLYKDLQPIPITREVLIKAGFRELELLSTDVGKGTIRYSKNAPNPPYTETAVYITNYKGMFSAYLREIKYLHQVQNLFFGYTFQEIEVSAFIF